MTFVITPEQKKVVDDWFNSLSKEEQEKHTADFEKSFEQMLKDNPHIKVISQKPKDIDEYEFVPESFKFRPLDKCEDNVIKNIDIVVNLKDTDLDEKELVKLVEKKLKEISMNIDDWYLHDTDKRTTIKRKENA
jgi:hypothetical protein